MKRLNIAMLGEQAQVAEPVQSELEVLGSQVEDDLLQAQQKIDQESNVDQAVEDAIEATDQLGEEAQAAQEILDNGGEVTQAALESIQRNVKRILKTVGMEKDAVGMETYRSSPKVSLEIATEGIKEIVNKIWEAIKNAWNRVVDFVKDIFKRFTDGAYKLKKRAQQVLEEASKLKGKTLGKTGNEFKEPSSLNTYMRYGHKPAPAAGIYNGIVNMNSIMNGVVNDFTSKETLQHYEKSLDVLIKKHVDKIKRNPAAEEATQQDMEAIFQPVIKHLSTQGGDGKVGTKPFLSDNVIYFSTKDLTVGIEPIMNKKDFTEKYDPIAIPDIIAVCEVVIEQMDEYKNLDQLQTGLDKFTNSFIQKEKEFVKSSEGLPPGQAQVFSYVVSRFVNKIIDILRNVNAKIRVLNLNINKSVIDWCAASLPVWNESTEIHGIVPDKYLKLGNK